MAAAASRTSARGALSFTPLAGRPPPAAPRPPRLAGSGRRQRGHVALGPAAAGRCLHLPVAPARPLGLGCRGRAGGAEPRGWSPGAWLGRSRGGGRSRQSPAQLRAARARVSPPSPGRWGCGKWPAASYPRFSVIPRRSWVPAARSGGPEETARNRKEWALGRGKRLAFPASSNLGHV